MIKQKIVLFDGVCSFCHGAVQFILKYEKTNELLFCSLQSDYGVELCKKYRIPTSIDSVILIVNNTVYVKSDAALHLANELRFPLSFLFHFRFVPKTIRDSVYDFIARHRYKWFPPYESCPLPTTEQKQRFLEKKA